MAELTEAVHQLPAHTPNSDGKLFDVLHDMYGIGTYDDSGPVQWWKFRATEVAKIKASRTKNDRSVADLYIAALYARAHGVDIRGVTFLMRHIPRAWAWWDDRTRQVRQTPDELYAAAIRTEAANPDPAWLNRLLRAAPSMREEVLAEWRSR